MKDRKERSKRYRIKHSKELTLKAKLYNWKGKNPDKAENMRLFYLYGITLNKYNELFDQQKGLCAICGKPSLKKLRPDHNHKTQEVRALLCHKCNIGLGMFNEDIELLQKVILYLLQEQ